jgi:hypothetical protein
MLVGGALVIGLWGKGADFAAAIHLAPLWILAIAILLHVATAAAGALLTATGALGAVCFASWALVDRLRPSATAGPSILPS